jgi:hypothetical protein
MGWTIRGLNSECKTSRPAVPTQPALEYVPGSFLGTESAGRGVERSTSSSAEVKNDRIYISTAHMYRHGMHRDKIAFTF